MAASGLIISALFKATFHLTRMLKLEIRIEMISKITFSFMVWTFTRAWLMKIGRARSCISLSLGLSQLQFGFTETLSLRLPLRVSMGTFTTTPVR